MSRRFLWFSRINIVCKFDCHEENGTFLKTTESITGEILIFGVMIKRGTTPWASRQILLSSTFLLYFRIQKLRQTIPLPRALPPPSPSVLLRLPIFSSWSHNDGNLPRPKRSQSKQYCIRGDGCNCHWKKAEEFEQFASWIFHRREKKEVIMEKDAVADDSHRSTTVTGVTTEAVATQPLRRSNRILNATKKSKVIKRKWTSTWFLIQIATHVWTLRKISIVEGKRRRANKDEGSKFATESRRQSRCWNYGEETLETQARGVGCDTSFMQKSKREFFFPMVALRQWW